MLNTNQSEVNNRVEQSEHDVQIAQTNGEMTDRRRNIKCIFKTAWYMLEMIISVLNAAEFLLNTPIGKCVKAFVKGLFAVLRRILGI